MNVNVLCETTTTRVDTIITLGARTDAMPTSRDECQCVVRDDNNKSRHYHNPGAHAQMQCQRHVMNVNVLCETTTTRVDTIITLVRTHRCNANVT
jgi:hypothetical protein